MGLPDRVAEVLFQGHTQLKGYIHHHSHTHPSVPQDSESPNCAGPPGFQCPTSSLPQGFPSPSLLHLLFITLLLKSILGWFPKAVLTLGPGFLFQAQPTQDVCPFPQRILALGGAAGQTSAAQSSAVTTFPMLSKTLHPLCKTVSGDPTVVLEIF